MDIDGGNYNNNNTETHSHEDEDEESLDVKRGPWALDEDLLLINYIAIHGEGRWNCLARAAGLKRTGKSCRLRWLNYLRPDVRRGNLTPEEQLTILQLHSRWGNRWSKIAQHLPGRTDNEIKNYWRTRVQKHAKQLGCDVDSKLFKDTMQYCWIPRLVERINAASASSSNTTSTNTGNHLLQMSTNAHVNTSFASENSGMDASSNINFAQGCYSAVQPDSSNSFGTSQSAQNYYGESLTSPLGYVNQGLEFQGVEQNNDWMNTDDLWGNLSDVENLWFQ